MREPWDPAVAGRGEVVWQQHTAKEAEAAASEEAQAPGPSGSAPATPLLSTVLERRGQCSTHDSGYPQLLICMSSFLRWEQLGPHANSLGLLGKTQ